MSNNNELIIPEGMPKWEKDKYTNWREWAIDCFKAGQKYEQDKKLVPNGVMNHDNELKCTPGEWHITTENNSDYADIDSLNGRIVSVLLRDETKEAGEAEANAHLIASSKDLYEALKRQHEILIRYYEVYNNVFTKSELADLRSEMYNILNLLQKANPYYKP